jgi:hypothetical protein
MNVVSIVNVSIILSYCLSSFLSRADAVYPEFLILLFEIRFCCDVAVCDEGQELL